MNEINWLEVFNSATTFGLLAVIAIGIFLLLLKKDARGTRSKSSKR